MAAMRRLILAPALLALAGGACAEKVFRYAFEIAETSFDPHKISDLYSNVVNQAMFDPPLGPAHTGQQERAPLSERSRRGPT